VLTSTVDLFAAGYDKPRALNFRDQLIDRARALPGVRAAAFSMALPFSYGGYPSAQISVVGYVPGPDEQPNVEFNAVSPGYFSTVGISVLSGREFTRADDEKSGLVAVVNEAMAAKYWPGRNPVGEHIQNKNQSIQIVGLAKNSKYGAIRETPKPFYYVPMRQYVSVTGILYLQTPLSPTVMAPAIAREIRAVDPMLAPMETITMREQVDRRNFTQRLAFALLGVFGGLAVVLAAIGLYGVMSYAVSQSKRELALRMALGAGASNLLRLVMSQGLMLTAGGVALGAIAALALTRLMGDMLYKVSPRDPLSFGAALLVMTIVSMAASFLPAWRATRTDPARVLRD
jgi:predicted permease